MNVFHILLYLYHTNNNLINVVVQHKSIVFKSGHQLEPDCYQSIATLISHACGAHSFTLECQYLLYFIC